MKTPNQIGRIPDAKIEARDLLEVPKGSITEEGLRWNIDVGIQYLSAWLGGNGCVPIYNLMEDAATAEICRAQVWQWVRHGAVMSDGRGVTAGLVKQVIREQAGRLERQIGNGALARTVRIYERMMTSREFPEFLTLVAYDSLD
jgi:malate synthase